MKKLIKILFLVPCMLQPHRVTGEAMERDIRHYTPREIVRSIADREEGFLAGPSALAFGDGFLYVSDSEECDIKIFSADGKLMRSVGRKGQGPGEFNFPSGLFLHNGLIYVADKLNFRIQILDTEGGFLRSFKVPFAPDRIFVLSDDVILVTHNPMNRAGREKMLHAFDGSGRLQWESLESYRSGDPVYDSFMNMILVSPGASGGFYVVYKCREHPVLHFDARGRCSREIHLDERYKVKALSLPFQRGRKEIRGMCWSWGFDRGRFYLLAPEYTTERDLGPGRQVFIFDGEGRLDGIIDLPGPLIRIAVHGNRIYAVDEERDLRIFGILGQ